MTDPALLIYAMAVVPVLEALPARADVPADAIERWAEQIALAADGGGMAEGMRNARIERRTDLKAVGIEAAAARLLDALAALDAHSLDTIQRCLPPNGLAVLPFSRALREWRTAAAEAANASARRRARHVTKGARPKVMAIAVTEAAEAAYQEITGRDATIVGANGRAGGAYLGFLRDILKATGIHASAEAQARALMEKKKEAAAI